MNPRWPGDLLHDMRYAGRVLLRAPAFTATVLLTLTIGIGGTVAIFSVADAVLFKPLGYREPEQLYVVHEVLPAPGRGIPEVPVNTLHFDEWRRSTRSFAEMALIAAMSVTLTGNGEPQRIDAARISPNLFGMLGLLVRHGRLFSDDEGRPGADSVVVLGDDLWRRQFGGDADVIGRTITLDGTPHVVIGVLANARLFPKTSELYQMRVVADRPQLWKPFAWPAERTPTDFREAAIVRVKTGVSVSDALEDLNAVQAQLGKRLPGTADLRAALVPLKDQLTGRSRGGLELLLATAGIVLLAGCVNVSSLLLTRHTGRRREFAIRQAAGASGGRLARQLLAESLVLGVAGGVLGIAFANAAVRLIVMSAPAELPRIDQVAFDARALLFTAVVSIAVGLVVGLMPAWRLSRTHPVETLKVGAATLTAGGRSTGRSRSLLIGVEVAASTMCVVVAGLLVSSFITLLHVNRGFATTHVIGATFSLPRTRYDTAEATRFLEALRDGARAIPGVVSVGLSDRLPLSGEGGNRPLAIEGSVVPEFRRPIASLHLADASFFRTMSIPLVAGRLFADVNRRRTTVALVSTSTAERLWPQQDVIGKRFRLGADDSTPIEVVGVVGDIRGVSLESAPRLDVYLPYWFTYIGQASLSVRTTADATAVISALREVVRRTDPQLAVPPFQTMDELLAESIAPRRFQLTLVLLFAATALLLAVIGIYGTTSHAAAMRTTEIGIRMALGARHSDIRSLILTQGLKPIAAGVAAGLLMSISLGGGLRTVLFGISHHDGPTLAAAAGILGVVGVVATYLPARRAMRANPIRALRQG